MARPVRVKKCLETPGIRRRQTSGNNIKIIRFGTVSRDGVGNDPYYYFPFRELFGPADGAGISKFNARRKISPAPLPRTPYNHY